MPTGEQTIVKAGARSVWRHQGILWWLFAVNVLLAVLTALPISSRLHTQLDYSLYSERLSSRFDVNALTELLSRNDGLIAFGQSNALAAALLYGVFVLFATGGVLAAYGAEVKLKVESFFQNCGAHFLRLVRLLLCFLGVLVLVTVLVSPLLRLSASLLNHPTQQHIGFVLGIVGISALLLCSMAVRLWFDMSQVQAVMEDDRSMLRCVARSFILTFGNFGTLFWMYLRISILNWLAIAGAISLWIHLPARSWESSLALGEVIALFSIAARLWQRASEIAWYHGRKKSAVVATA